MEILGIDNNIYLFGTYSYPSFGKFGVIMLSLPRDGRSRLNGPVRFARNRKNCDVLHEKNLTLRSTSYLRLVQRRVTTSKIKINVEKCL